MIRSTLFGAALAGLALPTAAQVFSLDDNPDNPLTAPLVPGMYSAEDPYGVPPVLGTIGPSPTLLAADGSVFFDGDLLIAPSIGIAPTLELSIPWADGVNAISSDHFVTGPDGFGEIKLRFSVDRMTTGRPGTTLEAQHFLNQQAGDIFLADQWYMSPRKLAGALLSAPCSAMPRYAGRLIGTTPTGGNSGEQDESTLKLVAGTGAGNVASGAFLSPVHGAGTHDNVDAYNTYPAQLDADDDGVSDVPMYVSVSPAGATASGYNPADIIAAGLGGAPYVFATASQCGLLDMTPTDRGDDIDAMVVWSHMPFDGVLDLSDLFALPGEDCALFSLSPGSQTLELLNALCGVPADGSTVFYTDFTGRFGIYAMGAELGVADRTFPAPGEHANIDALEIWFQETTGCTGDVNNDGVIDPSDLTAWLACFNQPGFASFCPRADVNGDGSVDPSDFTAWLGVFGQACP